MGLREKVALTIILLIYIQIISISCSPKEKKQSKSNSNKRTQAKTNFDVTQPPLVNTFEPHIQYKSTVKKKRTPEKNLEDIRKQFNFPDVDYPTVSTPRPPFYLQETNILQRNPIQKNVAYPTSTTMPYSNSYPKICRKNELSSRQKYFNNVLNTKTIEKPGTRPYNFRKEEFPNVEYPVSGKDTRIPNNWKQLSSTPAETRITRDEGDLYARLDVTPIQNNRDSKSKHYDKTGINSVNSEVPRRDTTTDQNILDKTESNRSKTKNQKTRTKSKKAKKKKYTTPAPIQDTELTTPFVLTPYTTFFFNTTPLIMDSKSSPEHSAKKLGGKKKVKVKSSKKDKSPTNSAECNVKTTTPATHITEKLSSSYVLTTPVENTTSLPQERTKSFTTSIPMEEPERCTRISNDTMLSKFAVSPTPLYHYYDNLTPTPPFMIYNDEGKPATPSDNLVASIYDAKHSVSTNICSNDASCLQDNVINSNKSSACDSNGNNYALSSQDSNIPTIDEEFTTDTYPNSDEKILPAFTVTTSTISPLTVSTVDDTWANTDVIDPYKSLSYPDELEQYYIMVT